MTVLLILIGTCCLVIWAEENGYRRGVRDALVIEANLRSFYQQQFSVDRITSSRKPGHLKIKIKRSK